MKELLKKYCVRVEYPEVSGAEHLQMLRTRDKIAEIKSTLTEEEKMVLDVGWQWPIAIAEQLEVSENYPVLAIAKTAVFM